MGNNLEFRPLGKTSESIPEVGMGTWGMGGGMRADSSRDSESIEALKLGLERLRMKKMDLYQLHWPNPRIPIAETMKAMEKLVKDGVVRNIGVSNFSVVQMKEAQAALSREEIVSNQVEYSLVDRAVEETILPYCQRAKITLIAYSPLGQSRIAKGRGGPFKTVDEIATRLGKSRSQVALNWLLRH